ncbi:ARPC1B [Symbiodinium sp. CCMP2456]|nr:ARPC1B [Symbiodinium sp. CCMP2456]
MEAGQEDEDGQEDVQDTYHRVCFRSAVNGEVLAELYLDRDTPLVEDAQYSLRDLHPFQLLYEGRNCDRSTLADLGIPHGSDVSVDLVRLPKPKEFKKLGNIDVGSEGYHCHDSYMVRLACQDPQRFCLGFCRHFHGSDFHTHIQAIRQGKHGGGGDQPYFEEVVVVDAVAEKILSGESIQNMVRSVCCYRDMGTGGFRVMRPLALAEDDSVYLLTAMNGAGGAQEYQMYRAAHNSQNTDPESLELLFNAGDMCIFNCIFAKGSFFALAAKADGQSKYILELRLCEGQFTELRRVPLVLPNCEGWSQMSQYERHRPRFLCLDDTGDALWVNSTVALLVLPIDTLEPHTCCLWKDLRVAEPREHLKLHVRSVLLHKQTREVYLLFDNSTGVFHSQYEDQAEVDDLSIYDPCFVRRLLPSPEIGPPWKVCYEDLPGDKVATANFTIDGFSDSFCFTESHMLESPFAHLQVFDAEGGFWELKI